MASPLKLPLLFFHDMTRNQNEHATRLRRGSKSNLPSHAEVKGSLCCRPTRPSTHNSASHSSPCLCPQNPTALPRTHPQKSKTITPSHACTHPPNYNPLLGSLLRSIRRGRTHAEQDTIAIDFGSQLSSLCLFDFQAVSLGTISTCGTSRAWSGWGESKRPRRGRFRRWVKRPYRAID